MPYKERELQKVYYSISEVSEILKVNASLIRFWEKEFEYLQPKKNKKGNRMFSHEDIEQLKIVYNLVKEKGFTLQGAKDYLQENRSHENDKQKVLNSLNQLKVFLLDLKKSL